MAASSPGETLPGHPLRRFCDRGCAILLPSKQERDTRRIKEDIEMLYELNEYELEMVSGGDGMPAGYPDDEEEFGGATGGW